LDVTSAAGANAGLAEIEALGYPVNSAYGNVAELARISASSERIGSPAVKAADGLKSGYPYDSGNEWVSESQSAGAWLELAWDRPYRVQTFVLYDRPDLSSRILQGNLRFDDGSSVAIGSLSNDGTGKVIRLPQAKVTRSVKLTVTSATGQATGLSEVEVFGRTAD
jgi:hypothetical protein